MARLLRVDDPGTWHHVMNRGIARRTVFENARDSRYFLAQLARAARAGRIEVHSYCLLTTHFHLLVHSPRGLLSRAIGEAVNEYVRWFNRGRRRDGSLFRGRFLSRTVDSLAYRSHLVRYIDANPVLAKLVPRPELYPHGSAKDYARAAGPPWLERSWVEEAVRIASGRPAYDPAGYAAVFGKPLHPGLARVIERRIEIASRGSDPLDDLLGASPDRVLEWMRRKAALADGTSIDWPVCTAEDLADVVRSERALCPDWTLRVSREKSDAWRLVEAALLRELCGESWRQVGVRLGISNQGAAECYRRHARALAEDPEYAQALGRAASRTLELCYGSRRPVGASATTGSVLE